MPQLVKKRRSGWAVLAVGALVASILAVGTGAVSAQPASTITAASPNHDPDAGADWSACVGEAGTYDAMFSDVGADDTHAAAINCIAYYGITLGKGDGTYAPDEHVSAFQMGLFVQRAADLVGADGEAVLAGVMLSDTVTRLEMAQLMFGLVNDIDDDVRISPADGQIEFYDEDTRAWVVVDDFFADAKALVPIFESQLIGATYELGITRGTRGDGTLVSTPDSTFEPFAHVTRAQMASFIARTLDHSSLRPGGLAIQRNLHRETMVSLRDADFAPIPDARIDVFSALYPDDAFDADDGECEGRFVRDETPSHEVCAIDIGDQLTDDEGNVEFTLVSDSDPITAVCSSNMDVALKFETAAGSEGRTFWAWTGVLGDEIADGVERSALEGVARPVGKAGPESAQVSGGLPTGNELAKMGETVTFTLQLLDANGDPAGPDRSGNPYHLRIEKYFVDSNGDSDSDAATNVGSANMDFPKAPGDWDYISLASVSLGMPMPTDNAASAMFQTPTDTVMWPDSDGRLPIRLTHMDLNAAPAVDNTDVAVKFTLTPFTPGNDLISGNLLTNISVAAGTNAATAMALDDLDRVTGYAIFSDDASDPHSVSGSSSEYRIIAGRTGNSVTVSVLDQYGDGMRNVEVSVYSSLDVIDPGEGSTGDLVVYPEEVDITVQSGENADGDETVGESTDVDRGERANYFAFTAGVAAQPNATPPVAGIASTIEVANPKVVKRNPMTVSEDDVEGTFRTRRDGTYRIGYTYIGTTAITETITPESVEIRRLEIDDKNTLDPADDTGSAPTAVDQEIGGEVKVYWTRPGNSGASTGGRTGNTDFLPVLVRDVPNQTIVVNEPGAETDADNPMAYFYDEDDTFIVAGVGATFEMFEEALSATWGDDGVYVDYVMWENYVISRPGRVNRTVWELTVSCTAPSSSLNAEGNAWSAGDSE